MARSDSPTRAQRQRTRPTSVIQLGSEMTLKYARL
jgi:hypothetical protein